MRNDKKKFLYKFLLSIIIIKGIWNKKEIITISIKQYNLNINPYFKLIAQLWEMIIKIFCINFCYQLS